MYWTRTQPYCTSSPQVVQLIRSGPDPTVIVVQCPGLGPNHTVLVIHLIRSGPDPTVLVAH